MEFTNIALKGATVIFPGDVVWDGKYVAVGDQEYEIVGSPPEYDSAIYQTTGAGGKTVGATDRRQNPYRNGFEPLQLSGAE